MGTVDVELEVIVDHPGVARRHTESIERVAVDHLVGLARGELALDHDDIEEGRQFEPRDLVALLAGVAVGDEAERDAVPPQVLAMTASSFPLLSPNHRSRSETIGLIAARRAAQTTEIPTHCPD